MKNKLNNIDWKEVGWKFLKFLLFLILNTPTILFVVGNMIEVPITTKTQEGGTLNWEIKWIDWVFDYAKNVQQIRGTKLFMLKATYYVSIALTLYASYRLILYFYQQKKEDKRLQKTLAQNEVNTNKIIEAIQNKEQSKKEEKNVSKYL